ASAALSVLEKVLSELESNSSNPSIRRAEPLENMAVAYIVLGKIDRAHQIHEMIYHMYVEALRQGDPKKIGFSKLVRFAMTLANDARPEMRSTKETMELATMACDITAHQNPDALIALAFAQASNGDFASAIENLDKVATLQSKGDGSQ